MSDLRTSLRADSLRVLADIGKAGIFHASSAWCCFHFLTAEDQARDRWGADSLAVQLSRPLFEALPFEITVDYIGGSVGIEAWERVIPTLQWVDDRLPRMWEIAEAAQMSFLGWTFEPKEPARIFQAAP